MTTVADDEKEEDLKNPNYRGKHFRPDNVLVDSQIDDKGYYWQGPNSPMPQGFTLDLGNFVSLHHVDIRNGWTKLKVAAVEDFEILLGDTVNGPWKSAVKGTLLDEVSQVVR